MKEEYVIDLQELEGYFNLYIAPYVTGIGPTLDKEKLVIGEFLWSFNLPSPIKMPTISKFISDNFIPTDIKRAFNNRFDRHAWSIYYGMLNLMNHKDFYVKYVGMYKLQFQECEDDSSTH